MPLSFDYEQQLRGAWQDAQGFLIAQWQQSIAQLSSLDPLRLLTYTSNATLVTDSTGQPSFQVPTAGVWQNVFTTGFDATYFSGNMSMTWTVTAAQVEHYRYMVIGKTLFLSFLFSGTTVGGTPSYLLAVKLPVGYFGAASGGQMNNGTISIIDGGGRVTGNAYVDGNGSTLNLERLDTANYTAGSVSVWGSVFLEVN